MYETGLGRWTSRDPAGYRGGIDLYCYILSNPARDTDPTGRWPDGGIAPSMPYYPPGPRTGEGDNNPPGYDFVDPMPTLSQVLNQSRAARETASPSLKKCEFLGGEAKEFNRKIVNFSLGGGNVPHLRITYDIILRYRCPPPACDITLTGQSSHFLELRKRGTPAPEPVPGGRLGPGDVEF